MDTSKADPRFTKSGLWQLFVVIAFPMHVWAIIMILMDLSWVAERSNIWDAIGAAAYGLMFIFFESLILFMLMAFVGLILPKNWPGAKRITFLGTLVLIILIWAILGQLYFLLELSFSTKIIDFLVANSHPLWVIYGSLIMIITPTVALPGFAAIRFEKFQQWFASIVDRLSVLMVFYLFLDLVSIAIVLIRNLG